VTILAYWQMNYKSGFAGLRSSLFPAGGVPEITAVRPPLMPMSRPP